MTRHDATVTTADGTTVHMTRWPNGGQPVVLLHANVADRRSWTAVGDLLAEDGLDVTAPDRRGFGQTSAGSEFTHVEDLLTVLDETGHEPAALVGNSMGGGLALDTALLHPDRVRGAVLIGAGVSGMTDDDTPFAWAPDAASGALLDALGRETGVDEQIRLLTHLWLDGPEAPEGRVAGTPRSLFAAMNRRILDVDAPDDAGDAGVDAWSRLGELEIPVVCAWGALDVPADLPFYAETERRIGRGPGIVLPDAAHLPGLERPELTAELVRDALRVFDEV